MKTLLLIGLVAVNSTLAFAAHRESFNTAVERASCGQAGVEVAKACASLEKSQFSSEQQEKIYNRDITFMHERIYTYKRGVQGQVDLCNVEVKCEFDLSDL